ncbi:hypothetical protein CJJ07_001929 [Candidozyma auris]|nr:hypothetical protein CJJ07_001929 [[Candida] auris]QEL61914.1 hypothetical protein CJJ09_004076 [[Candida] auris]
MLVHRKQQGPKLDKPNRFNLGGLIKRKISWKRSIDGSMGSLDSFAPPQHKLPDQQPSPATHNHYYTVDCHHDASSAPHYSLTAANGHYTHLSPAHDTYCSTAECISLQNSDITSHHGDDDDDGKIDEFDSLCKVDDFNNLAEPLVDESPSFDPKNEENISEYKIGGYCPIKIGDHFCSDKCRYKVLRKLGWGHFSTVWLAISSVGSYVALKVVKSGKNYSEAAIDEIKILKTLQKGKTSSVDSVVSLLDSFEVTTPSGTHVAMVFELMGENMLHLIYKKKAERYSLKMIQQPLPPAVVPLHMAKSIILQLLQSVDYMHRNGVIHTDIKPENVLMTYEGSIPDSVRAAKPTPTFRILPSRPLAMSLEEMCSCPMRVKIADLGNATYSKNHFSDYIQTRQYRSPEILLKHKTWGASADVWSIGCLIFELITGDFLFDPHDGATFTKDEDHMAQIIELLGEFPSVKYLSNCSRATELFSTPTTLRNIRSLKYWSLEDVLIEKYKFSPDDENVILIGDLIRKCLKYDLDDRYDCASLMKHPWFSSNPQWDEAALRALPNNNTEIPGFTHEE